MALTTPLVEEVLEASEDLLTWDKFTTVTEVEPLEFKKTPMPIMWSCWSFGATVFL